MIRDERGATAVEYGFMLVMIVLAMMSALSGVADQTAALWTEVSSKTAEATGN
jgi:pilus assembly protein Flp/PilA